MGMQILFFLGCKLNTAGVLNFHYVGLQKKDKRKKNKEKLNTINLFNPPYFTSAIVYSHT